MNRKVILYGELAEKFGREFTLNVKTPMEAIRALCAIVPGFRKWCMYECAGLAFVCGDKLLRSKEEVDMSFGDAELRIVPRVRGSGAAARIVVGIILIVIDFFIYGSDGGQLTALGIALIVGGAAQIIFAPTKNDAQGDNPTSGNANYAFNGPQNTVRQGNPVPTGYGRVLTGSQVISAGLFVG